MSLDVSLTVTKPVEVFEANITHNLGEMAEAAGIYAAVWRPEDLAIEFAEQLVPVLEAGINELKANPERFKTLDAKNGWGTYDQFVPWLEKYLAACKENPEAHIGVSR